MRSKMCEMFGIDVPIFAFSHCRDVVAEVSRAGGMGILGMARMNPARVEAELAWIDEHVDGRPYGIDVLMPSRLDDSGGSKFDVDAQLPAEHVDFVRRVLDEAG
ncbi:MAG: nitronate monooxygenase, partial [Gammaproteobacteria bacterium]